MADYIIEPLDTDGEIIYQGFVEFVQGTFPDWEPSEGQLDTIIARYFAQQTAFTADMASRVLRAIYRYFGASLAGIAPLSGSSAQATVHFVISDPLDPPVERTLAFGTLLGLTDKDGDVQMFETLDDMVVLAGETEGEVLAQALEPGSISNDISGGVELIELVDWITSANVVGTSSGGSDDEDDDVYIQRLTDNLALMAPRPILAEDFAVFAQNIPGVWRVAVIDNFGPGVNEVQRLVKAGTSSWTLNFQGQTTAGISTLATANEVRDAMLALPNFDITDGLFTGGPWSAGPDNTPILVEFRGKWGYQPLPLMTGSAGVAISGVTDGELPDVTTANSISISAVDESGNILSPAKREELLNYLRSTRPQNFQIVYLDPGYHEVAVTYTVRALKFQEPDVVRTQIDIALGNYLDPANWGVYPFQSDSRNWLPQSTIRYLELTTLVENTPGVDYVESLTFSLDGGPFNTSDKNFGGTFALTIPGTFTGTVNLPS